MFYFQCYPLYIYYPKVTTDPLYPLTCRRPSPLCLMQHPLLGLKLLYLVTLPLHLLLLCLKITTHSQDAASPKLVKNIFQQLNISLEEQAKETQNPPVVDQVLRRLLDTPEVTTVAPFHDVPNLQQVTSF